MMRRLADDVQDLLDHEPDVHVSVATIWEAAVKQAIGKLQEPKDLPERIRDSGFRVSAIQAEHVLVAARLPLLHRDPFDRVLIAQALCELTLFPRDAEIAGYDVDMRRV